MKAAETAAWAVRDYLLGNVDLHGGDGREEEDGGKAADEGNVSVATALKAFDRIVFCVFGEADERAYKQWLP